MSTTDYLNNTATGLVDDKPYKAIDGNDRSWDFALSGLYNLPVGRGGALLGDAHGVLGQFINDWQLDWTFTNDSGIPASYPNASLFNYGNYNIRSAQRSYKSYLNNTQSNCFQSFPEYTATTQLPRTTVVRNPWAQQTALAVEKKFAIRESIKLQFKAEAFNATNTTIFGAPSSSSPQTAPVRTSVADPNQPGAWSGFGTISSTQQNFPRQMQMSLKLLY